jgi:uncharacterized membrane protein
MEGETRHRAHLDEVSSRRRVAASAALAAVDLVTLVVLVGAVHGPVRFIFGLAFVVVVPGWSLVGLVGLANAPLEFALSVAVSLASLMLGAQVMMAMGLWHPVAFAELVGVACLPSLFWQSRSVLRAFAETR